MRQETWDKNLRQEKRYRRQETGDVRWVCIIRCWSHVLSPNMIVWDREKRYFLFASCFVSRFQKSSQDRRLHPLGIKSTFSVFCNKTCIFLKTPRCRRCRTLIMWAQYATEERIRPGVSDWQWLHGPDSSYMAPTVVTWPWLLFLSKFLRLS